MRSPEAVTRNSRSVKVGTSDYERTSAGTRGNDEDAPISGRSPNWDPAERLDTLADLRRDENVVRDVPLTVSFTAANHVIVLRQDPFIPFGLERQRRGYRECR